VLIVTEMNLKTIDRLIKTFRQEQQLFFKAGLYEDSLRSSQLEWRYMELKFNGHTHTLRRETSMELMERWKNEKRDKR